MKNKKDGEWLQDYEEFLKEDRAIVPQETKDLVFNKIQNLINPNSLIVFLKILGIHLGVGFLSLSICHQFGANPFNTENSLDNWMMQVGGHQFCMIGCGILFISLSLFAAGYFLTVEEINSLRKTKLLQTLALGLISLGMFEAFGAELALGIAGLWLLGSLVGGLAATEAVWRLKRIPLN